MARRFMLLANPGAIGYCIGVVLISISSGYSQYFQFSQYNYTLLRVNPAVLGTSKFAYLDFDYRNQKTGGEYSLNSNFVSASVPLLNQSTGKPWSGVGVSLMDDRSAGVFKTQEIALSYAVNTRLSRYQQISLGVKGLYQTRRINLDGLYTESQYVPDRGFDQNAFSGEDFQKLQTNLYTFSAGLYWQQTDRKENVTRSEEVV